MLLYGPPGTGKTLLARAVAGEAGVPFYSISGSDFVEMFVGVGASRVRDLFEQAKQNAPCIIFVDEIDAVGRHRGAGLGGGHDEREQTLNQLLVEMDGFDVARRHHPDRGHQPARHPGPGAAASGPVRPADPRRRTRPARPQGHPAGARQGQAVAPRTPTWTAWPSGPSGSPAPTWPTSSTRPRCSPPGDNGTIITGAALEESVDRVIGGPARKSKIISEKEKKITAYHEAGHALAAWAMPDIDPVYKVTILPRGRTGGHTLSVPEEDKDLMTRSEMIARLVFALGGRAAEELVFHEPTTGASNDIEQATKIARAMVTDYGMSASLGAVKYGQHEGEPFLGRQMSHAPDYSLEVAHEIDEEVRKLIEAAHDEAWEVLDTYRDVLDDLVLELVDKETLHQKDLERVFARVQKRPRITEFNNFGNRTPSDKPPIKTPGELAKERGEPWPPVTEEEPAPTPVATVPGGGELPGTNGSAAYPPARPSGNAGGPPNYGAPPGWTPATQPNPNGSWTPNWDQNRPAGNPPTGNPGDTERDSGR